MTAALTLPDWPVGIFDDVPAEVYHRKQLGVATSHALGAILRSPAHYRAWLTEPERETKALNFGRAAHAALLEPEVFRRTYVVQPDFGDCRANEKTGTTKEQGKANKVAKEAWEAANKGRTWVTAEDMRTIEGMAEALTKHDDARDLIEAWGRSEVTAQWECPTSGLKCKMRMDLWVQQASVVVDFKTTEDARERAFARAARDYGYRRQAAHYLSGLAALGYTEATFSFIVQEKSPPFAVEVYELDEEVLAAAVSEVDEAKRIMANCIRTGEWPSYGTRTKTIYLERWER